MYLFLFFAIIGIERVHKVDKSKSVSTVTTGYVTGITNYGIFVKLGKDRTGLIHISEISNRFVSDISKYVTIGEIIRVKIIGYENGKYQLSIKDIDYRIMKKRGSKIEETESGFKNLARSLDFWIEREKLKK